MILDTAASTVDFDDPTLVKRAPPGEQLVGQEVVYRGSLPELRGRRFRIVDDLEELPTCRCPNWSAQASDSVSLCEHLPHAAYRIADENGLTLICRWSSVRWPAP